MTDLVSRLLEAIEEAERLARLASDWNEPGVLPQPPRPEWTVQQWADPDETAVIADRELSAYPVARLADQDDGEPSRFAAHIAHNDPSSVLRRCAADRRVVERHARRTAWIDDERDVPVCACCGTHYEYPVRWPCPDLRVRAEAYGLEVTE